MVVYTYAFEGKKDLHCSQDETLGIMKHLRKILCSVFYKVIYILWPLGCQMLVVCPLVAQIISMLLVMKKTGDALVRK